MKITKTQLKLMIIFLIALIFRVIAAHNSHVSTDEMVYSIIPLNIINSGQFGTIEQSPLHFYLSDIGYKLFGGITAISVRLTSIIFGSMSTFVIFLVGRKLFNTKSGLLSSFLFAVSGYSIKFNYEMDMGAFFFSILSIYFFILFLEDNKSKNLYLTVISLGLAILIKNIVILFIPSFLIYLFMKRKVIEKGIFKKVCFALILFLTVLSPVFAYNYLTLQEKGITDYCISNIAGIGETVHKGLQAKPWSVQRLQSITVDRFKLFLKIDTIALIFGLFGIFYAYKTKKSETIFLFSSLLFLHLYVAGVTGSASHYLWYPLILSLFAGNTLIIFQKKIKFKQVLSLILFFTLISSMLITQEIISERQNSITLELRDYVHQIISEDAIVVIDPRIYTGIHAWVFNDRHYLEGTQFGQLIESINKIPGERSLAPIYYVECGEGSNCGWKPEDFARIYDAGEQISSNFKQNLKIVETIKTDHTFNIYRGDINIPKDTYDLIDRTHTFWFYPVGWKFPELAIDYYQVSGFNKFIHYVGLLILWINVILALTSIPFIVYLVLKKKSFKN